MVEKHRYVSDSQWRYLHSKINSLQKSVDTLRESFENNNKPKRGLRFYEVVPPESVCRDINSMLIGTNEYDGFLNRLADYYGVTPMKCYRDDDLDPKYKAEYRPRSKACFSAGPSIARATVLHEFFHHLQHEGVVFVSKKEQEEYADRYSKMFLQRAGVTSA